jgi:hypothetical protein
VSLSKPVARVLAPLVAMIIALTAFAAVSVSSVTTADAATAKVKIKTKGPYKKNQNIKVKVSGFPANAAIAIGICPNNIDPNGPGDCGPAKNNYSQLQKTNAKGKLTVTLRVPKGKLGSLNNAKAKCNNKKKCAVFASTIGSVYVTSKTKALKYA